MGDFIAGGIVILLVGLALYKMYRDKKKQGNTVVVVADALQRVLVNLKKIKRSLQVIVLTT